MQSGILSDQPVITVRIEPNASGSKLIWSIMASDGTKANGFADCHADAMRDAAAFVEAMAQPRAGGLWRRPGLRVVGEKDATNA